MNNNMSDHRTLIKQLELYFTNDYSSPDYIAFAAIQISEYFTSSPGPEAPINPIALSKRLCLLGYLTL